MNYDAVTLKQRYGAGYILNSRDFLFSDVFFAGMFISLATTLGWKQRLDL
jgi:hypothetical protein